jgi:putative ABC transport system substrate-binding protein
MKRRQFLLAGALGMFVPQAFGQARPRIGMLAPIVAGSAVPSSVVRGLADLGYRDGSTMTLELRSTEGVAGNAARLARELLDLKCDLIFALGPENIVRPFVEARSAIPVVFFAVDYDPLAKGIVQSLRTPGRLTGVYLPALPLAAKRLEIALEVLPQAKRFLVLSDEFSKDQLEALTAASAARRVQLMVVEYKQQPYDLESAFRAGRKAGVDAYIWISSPALAARAATLSTLLVQHRLPGFTSSFMASHTGVLVASSADIRKAGRRVAEIGVRILKGAKSGDIPVEQADEYELVLNLKTAKTLGLKIPSSVMARATRLIE